MLNLDLNSAIAAVDSLGGSISSLMHGPSKHLEIGVSVHDGRLEVVINDLGPVDNPFPEPGVVSWSLSETLPVKHDWKAGESAWMPQPGHPVGGVLVEIEDAPRGSLFVCVQGDGIGDVVPAGILRELTGELEAAWNTWVADSSPQDDGHPGAAEPGA